MSDYDACSCDWDSDLPKLWHKTTRTARKQHRCCECTGLIQPGDRYQHYACLDEYDGWSSYRTCPECLEGPVAFVLRNCGCRTMGDGPFDTNWLYQHLFEVFCDYPFEREATRFKLGRMLVGMRRRAAAARSLAHATETTR